MFSGLKHIEWTIEQDLILIEFVRTHECLYNVKRTDYRNIQLKQSLWKEIAQILQLTDIDCSKRWGYVRDYYIKRRGKIGPGPTGEAARKRSDKLSFLDRISSGKRSTLSNIEQSESQHSVENSTAHYRNEDNHMELKPSELLITELETSNDISDIQEDEAEIINIQRVNKHKYDYTITSSSADERLKILKKISERQDLKNMEKQDENDLFFASMAKICKQLPKIVQARLRMQIGNLVGNAEIEQLSSLVSPDS